jgi:Rrf2 family protein
MIALASDKENQAQSTGSLAKRLEMPLPFMHQIAHALMQAGMIKATPGPRGGLRMNLQAEDVRVLDIVEALEGPVALNPCMDCNSTCPRQDRCQARIMWLDLQEKIISQLGSTTLAQLVEQPNVIPVEMEVASVAD